MPHLSSKNIPYEKRAKTETFSFDSDGIVGQKRTPSVSTDLRGTLMTLRSRARSVVLAGTLALSLTAGSLALATEAPLGSSATDEASDLGSAISQIATSPEAPAPQVATPAYVTVSSGPITYQVAQEWESESLGAEEIGGLYDIYAGTNGILQVIVVPESAIGEENAAIDSMLSSMSASAGMTSFTTDQPEDRTLDGTLIRDIDFEGMVDGVEFDGLATFVFGTDYTGIMVSVYADEYAEDDYFQVAHDSVSLTIANAESAAVAGYIAGGSSAGAVADPTASTPEAPAASASSSANGVIEFEGFTFAVNTEPDGIFGAVVESYEGDPLNGTQMIGIPVTITNNTGETTSPSSYLIDYYGPRGVEQDDMATYYFDDSVINVGNMRPGASVEAVLYFTYEGAGEYVATFDNYDDPVQEVVFDVQ